VTADDGSFGSGTLAQDAAFTRAFPIAGTFAYHCAIHPSMTGTVVVTP
jgi:plastocyanin